MLGDKGIDSDAICDVILDDLDGLPVIPDRRDRKGPSPRDDEMRKICKQRDRVERAFAKAKQFCRFSTSDEKSNVVYLGVARIGFGFMHVRKLL